MIAKNAISACQDAFRIGAQFFPVQMQILGSYPRVSPPTLFSDTDDRITW
jgi:hypothetical protein